ncbi:MAG: diguanylate cyclase [Desulfuromonadales bacterium]|nr:diguanylate cyclase [Desulfuromonadales bacterium]
MSPHSIPKIDILMTILKRLETGQKFTVGELAHELCVTERSVYRYLDTLQGAGYPIYYDRKLKTYRFVDSYKLRDSGSLDNLTSALDLKRQMFSSSSVGIATYKVDGSCVWANTALAHMLNTSIQQILAQNFTTLSSWRESGLLDLVNSSIQSNEESSRDLRLISSFGKELWAQCIASPFTSNGHSFILVMTHDISARKQKELALSTFAASISKGPNLVMITDLNGTIEYVSDKISEITGYTREEVIGATPRIFKSGFTPPSVYENMWETISSGREWTGELCNRRKSGSTYWEHIRISPIFDADGSIKRFVAVKEDVTRQKLLEEELYRHATGDSLTGLYNRRMTRELGNREISLMRRQKSPLALVVADIDALKKVNEDCDHLAGDAVLRAVPQAFRLLLHNSDILGRIGGDEFAVVLTGADADQSLQIAERLRKTIEELPVAWKDDVIRCTASIGIARLPEGDTGFDDLLDQAHQAAYKAYRRGGNRVTLFGPFDGSES